MFRKLFVLAAFLISGAANAQIPTTDIAAITQESLQHVESIAKYVQQIEQLKQQYEQAKQTYTSLSGTRSIGGLMNDQLAYQYLPKDYQKAFSAYQKGKSGSLSGISGSLNDIAELNRARACAETSNNPSIRQQCERKWKQLSMNQYVGEQGYNEAYKNIENLQQFVTSIKSAPDAKTMQDLQARIQVEQVKIQNEQMKLQTIAMMQQAQEKIRQQNAADNTTRMLQSGTGTGTGSSNNGGAIRF